MNNICFTVMIRQRMCQNGIPLTRENVYSNISSTANIDLLNGYQASFSLNTSDSLNLHLINPVFNIDINFIIQNNSISYFDLPVEGTIYRISIFVNSDCCCKQNQRGN